MCGFRVVILPHQELTIQPTAFPGGQQYITGAYTPLSSFTQTLNMTGLVFDFRGFIELVSVAQLQYAFDNNINNRLLDL